MKRLSFAVALVWVAFGTACEQQGPGLEKQAAVSGQEVEQEMGEAVSTAVAFSQQEADAYREKVESRIEKLEKDIASLRTGVEQKGARATADLREAVEDLEEQKESLKGRARELKTATAESWGELKSGLDEAMEDLESAYERTAAKLGA